MINNNIDNNNNHDQILVNQTIDEYVKLRLLIWHFYDSVFIESRFLFANQSYYFRKKI